MAVDMFLKIGTIVGESSDLLKHKDWVDVLSFSFGVTQPTSALAAGAARTVERASFGNFTIVKRLDKATPILMLACVSGEHFAEATIVMRKAGGTQQEFLRYTLQDCLISSVRPGGSATGGEALPLEEVSFSFSKIKWEYIAQKADGTADVPVSFGWDLAQNTKL